MEILFYRYGSICEPAILHCFEELGLTVLQDTTQITQKKLSPQNMVEAVSGWLSKHAPLFVFSINYFPVLASVCDIYQIPYVCWTVDAPVLELFSETLSLPCNRVFLFDRAQYEYFSKRAPEQCFYLPLACDPSLFDKTIQEASLSQLQKFNADISFVGSLYNEKDPYTKIKNIDDKSRGYVEGLMAAQMHVYGYNFLMESLPKEIISSFNKVVPDMHRPDYNPDPAYVLAHSFLGYHIAVLEREAILNALAASFSVDLYTRSDTARLENVHNRGGVQTLTEMPLVFHQSKINLNATIRPIQTGLPQRIFDICGCGGLLMTNYQEELPLYYEPGKEILSFSSIDELKDLCHYYLSHDTERQQIAIAGYERTCADHTYKKRITEMIRQLNNTI